MAAGEAKPEVNPSVTHFEAFLAAFGFGFYLADLVEVSTDIGHFSLLKDHFAAWIGMRTWKRVSPGTDVTLM